MSEQSQGRLGTEEDLIRHFGSTAPLLGSPVRPTPSTSDTSEPTSPTEDSTPPRPRTKTPRSTT